MLSSPDSSCNVSAEISVLYCDMVSSTADNTVGKLMMSRIVAGKLRIMTAQHKSVLCLQWVTPHLTFMQAYIFTSLKLELHVATWINQNIMLRQNKRTTYRIICTILYYLYKV